MNLVLKRDVFKGDCTLGSVSIDGKHFCYTVEDTIRKIDPKTCEGKIAAKTAIPAGHYEVVMTFSNRFQRYMPLLLEVPCFSGVRIHPGNTSENTEGCLIFGFGRTPTGVYQSRAAITELYDKIRAVEHTEKIFIEIT
jgi:hypothetical protein